MTSSDSDVFLESGFSYVLAKLRLCTPFGADLKKRLRPFSRDESKALELALDQVSAALGAIRKDEKAFAPVTRVMRMMRDIRGSLDRCAGNDTLDETEFFEIKNFCLLMGEFKRNYLNLSLSIPEVDFTSLSEVVKLLNPDEQIVPSFSIYSSYEPKLAEIRCRKHEIESLIMKEGDGQSRDRLLRQRQEIVVSEKAQELSVKKSLTARLSAYKNDILRNVGSIALLDLIIAKASLAFEYGAARPGFAGDDVRGFAIQLKEAFHPEVSDMLAEKGQRFIPLDLSLKKGVTILTGANMGGKSVALRTVLLNAVAARMGFFVFAKDCVTGHFENIVFLGGDLQDFTRGLSSFGAEIIRLSSIIETVKRAGGGLFVLDELARTTNPSEGKCFIKAYAKYMKGRDFVSLVSTHYDVSDIADAEHFIVRGLESADTSAMKDDIHKGEHTALDVIQKYMDYRIRKVESGYRPPHDALTIADLIGIDSGFVKLVENEYREERLKDGSQTES
ncbi:MAG: hypothetical protein HQK54_04770 [Oligoflexales bacterium]|nr:hypothetical protein [Oligoflexales bacterium]